MQLSCAMLCGSGWSKVDSNSCFCVKSTLSVWSISLQDYEYCSSSLIWQEDIFYILEDLYCILLLQTNC